MKSHSDLVENTYSYKGTMSSEPSITCSYIWHMETSKCAYWLDTHSVKDWWRYVLPNANAVHFCDIFSNIGQCFRPAQTKSLGNQK